MAEDGESLERRLKNALEKHKITLKVEQRQAIEQLYMKKKDLIAILPTGFGKSMIFQALVLLARYECEDDKRPVVLIITPLISIIKDQIVELESLGLLGCNLAEVLDDLSLLSRADLVYASAESAIDKRFSNFLKQKSNGFVDRALAIIVDESHTIQTWAGLSKDKNNKTTVAFRSSYGKLSFLRSFFGKDIPFAALTGTADEETQEIICSSLCMKDPLTIAISPNRKNVRFQVFHQKKEDMFSRLDWLIQDLMKNGMLAEKSIIFCNTMNEIARVVNYLILKLGDKAYSPESSRQGKDCVIGIFHSNTWPQQKDNIMKALKDGGKMKVVVASSALSMGVNFPDIRYVINWGPARNLLDQHQEAGRAGRDGLQSHNIVIYHGNQLSHCNKGIKEFVNEKSCHRVLAYKPFDPKISSLEPGHLCCSYCAKDCKCEGAGCSYMPLYCAPSEDTTAPTPYLTRPVSAEDKEDLKKSLEELQAEISTCKSLFNPVTTHWFSEELINDVVNSCGSLFTVDDVLNKCAVFSVDHALSILEIIQEIFLDIPNFDELMNLLKHEQWFHAESFDLNDYVDDMTADCYESSEDEWSDNEPINEI